MSDKTATGWAIWCPGEGSSWIGIGWFPGVTSWTRYAGHNFMIWPTRREARQALVAVRVPHGFPAARVERVEVAVRLLRRPPEGR